MVNGTLLEAPTSKAKTGLFTRPEWGRSLMRGIPASNLLTERCAVVLGRLISKVKHPLMASVLEIMGH
jgi:hypothetical protein